jgi:hypothetical protein
MKQRFKQYGLIAATAALLWFVLDNHFIFSGQSVRLLKKEELNLHDTFISLDNKKPESVLRNDRLREAGIGDVMVELGILSQNKKSELESKIHYGD